MDTYFDRCWLSDFHSNNRTSVALDYATYQMSMIRAFREQEGSHDVPYNPWIPATVNGLAICLYIVLLSVLVIWSIRAFSKNMALVCCSITLVGYTLFDLGVIFYYPLHLVAKCSLSDFHGIMRNCRTEKF
ncbi:hypothetical protein OUZ56_028667 [Daphnia magna]|uniref:Uncharacterized protein n=1 Tax=Daphnia magna TaxID=35525 RepID=A0ABR0B4J6_9CRUS|nr:hypothetical protein OUZ56_028667 [Daphnia magna]